ncbi:MAG: heme-binding protein [Candidatus Blackburnbacteria bacterium]|nr:heme-binding protein [Candidatus Blackburnbacteria bacterium]
MEQLARPAIERLCEQDDLRYPDGPAGLVLVVLYTKAPKALHFKFGELQRVGKKHWHKWNADFDDVAFRKALVALRTGRPTSEIAGQRSWLLEHGDTVYGGGVAEDNALAVAASGLKEEADEAAAWTVYNIIAMLVNLEFKKLKTSGTDNV